MDSMYREMYREEIHRFIAEHRRRLAQEFSSSAAQQEALLIHSHRWLARLGACLIACGQWLEAIAVRASTPHHDDQKAYAQDG